MPYRKNNNRNRKRKPNMAQRLQQLERQARKNKPELISYSKAVASTAPSTTAAVSTVFEPYFSSQNKIVGNSIQMKSIHIKCALSLHASATASLVRFIIVQYKEDGLPTPTDYLEASNIVSTRNIEHQYEFQTLYDRVHSVDSDDPKKYWDIRVKPKLPLNYVPASTTIANQGVYMILVSDEATNTPTLSYSYQVMYCDN